MEITVRTYAVQCSICLLADHGNQTILAIDNTTSGSLNVTSLNQPDLKNEMLKNVAVLKILRLNDASANNRLRYNFNKSVRKCQHLAHS